MELLLALVLVLAVVLAIADGYQAVTGKRLSKRPSRRTDEEMRRQSAIAATVLGALSLLLLVLLVLG